MDKVKTLAPKLVTTTLVIVAVGCAYLLYSRYTSRPWTRDGQVQADVVKIAPRVSGYLVQISGAGQSVCHARVNCFFRSILALIQLAVDQAQVDLDQAREDVTALEAAVRAAEATVASNATRPSLQPRSQIDEAQAGIESAEAATQEAEAGVTSAQAMIASKQRSTRTIPTRSRPCQTAFRQQGGLGGRRGSEGRGSQSLSSTTR
jgi:multidrug resistance efflux pump